MHLPSKIYRKFIAQDHNTKKKKHNSKSKGGNKRNLLNVTDTICKQSCKDWPSWNIQASSPGNFPLHTHTRAHTHTHKQTTQTQYCRPAKPITVIYYLLYNSQFESNPSRTTDHTWEVTSEPFFKLINKILLHNVYESLFLHCFNVV